MKRFLLSAIAAVTAALYSACAFAQQAAPQTGPQQGFGYGHRHLWGWGGGFMFHPFGSLLMVVLLILLFAWLLRHLSFGRSWNNSGRYGNDRYGGGRRALDILEERFAKGEIDRNEFEEKRRLLGR